MLAQMVDIMSGTPNSGFPGRKVRKLTRAASLGGESQGGTSCAGESAQGAQSVVISTPEKIEKGVDEDPEVLSQSEPEN